MIKSLKRLALIAIFSIAFVGTALAVDQGGFSASPTSPNKINPSQFSYEAKPGSTLQDTLTVVNHDTKPMKLFIYAMDSVMKDGKVQFKIESDPQTEVGKWTTVSQKEIDIPASSKQDIPFTITIPQDAALKDYLGGIAGEARSTDPTQGSQLKVNYRIVTKINLKVTNTPQPIEKRPTPPISPTQVYLYISAGLFVLVLAWFIAKSLQERKHRKSSSAHHQHPDQHQK